MLTISEGTGVPADLSAYYVGPVVGRGASSEIRLGVQRSTERGSFAGPGTGAVDRGAAVEVLRAVAAALETAHAAGLRQLQYDWDGSKGGFYHRQAVLPDDAFRATTEYFDSTTDGGWHHTVVRVSGTQVAVSLDGHALGGGASTFDLTGGCGSGIVLRVWSATVQFKNVMVEAL